MVSSIRNVNFNETEANMTLPASSNTKSCILAKIQQTQNKNNFQRGIRITPRDPNNGKWMFLNLS